MSENQITAEVSQSNISNGNRVSIRNLILIFTILATLIPSLVTSWISYRYSRSFIEDSIKQEFQNTTSHIARELELWLRERLYDARVFSSSYVIMQNVVTFTSEDLSTDFTEEAFKILKMYLISIHEKFPDYDELLIIDKKGKIIASNNDRIGSIDLPDNWYEHKEKDERLLQNFKLSAADSDRSILVGSIIRDSERKILGTLVIRINLSEIQSIITEYSHSSNSWIHMVDNNGQCFLNSHAPSLPPTECSITEDNLEKLKQRIGSLTFYRGSSTTNVVGVLASIPNTGWAVLVEKPTKKAFKRLDSLKTAAMLILAGLFLIIGLLGLFLSMTIIRPVKNLTAGASKVAHGDLTVDLPEKGPEEVVYLTRVFNDMVYKLRINHEQLEIMAVTDSLTGLYNRKHLLISFEERLELAKQNNEFLSIMMIDIDSFKQFNDKHGHQVGDDILIKTSQILRSTIDENEIAARYGGDEFLVILTGKDREESRALAENIRQQVAKMPISENENEGSLRVTISIGLSTFPDHGHIPKDLIHTADDALYQAKREGRNMVVLADAKG